MYDKMRWVPERDEWNQLSTDKFIKDFRHFSKSHHPLELLVREMAQNVIDAAAPGSVPSLEFSIERRKGEAWSSLAGGVCGRGASDDRPVRVLLVRDRGTRGLGGPVNFVNSGQDEASDYRGMVCITASSGKNGGSGGSYGLGRSLLFILSQTQTILIDSVYRDGSGYLKRRIVGMRLMSEADRKKYNESVSGAMAAGPVWWTREHADRRTPVEGPLDDPNSPVNLLGRQMGLRDHSERATGTDLYIVDFINRSDKATGAVDGNPESQDAEAVDVMYAAAAASLFQCLVNAQDIPKNLKQVTVKAPGREEKVDQGAIFENRALWPVRHLAEAYVKSASSGKPDAILTGHDLRSPGGNRAEAHKALRRVQPFSSLGENETDIFDSSEGVAIILPSRQSTRIVLDPWKSSRGSGKSGLTLRAEPGLWKIGILLVRDPTEGGLAERMRRTENEAHTQWRRAEEKAAWREVEKAADGLASKMGVLTEKTESESDSRLTRWGQTIGEAFTFAGRAPGGRTENDTGSKPLGGGGRVAYTHTLVSKGGREYHQYSLTGLTAGSSYEVSAHEYNSIVKPKNRAELDVLDTSGSKVKTFTATSTSATLLVPWSEPTSVEFRAKEA